VNDNRAITELQVSPPISHSASRKHLQDRIASIDFVVWYEAWPGSSRVTLLCCELQLAALDTFQEIEDMSIPGFRLPPLEGRKRVAGPSELMEAGGCRRREIKLTAA
jgi:hypothetical protein